MVRNGLVLQKLQCFVKWLAGISTDLYYKELIEIGTKPALLNQARTSHRLACAWFLKIDPVQIVSMHVCVGVCVSAPKAINNYWHDVAWYEETIWLVKQVL